MHLGAAPEVASTYRKDTKRGSELEQLPDDGGVALVGRFEQRRRAVLQKEAQRLAQRLALGASVARKPPCPDNGIEIPAPWPGTYVSGGIDLRASFQEPSHHVIVAHLRSYP